MSALMTAELACPQEQLRLQGYLIVRNFFPVTEITKVRQAQDAYYQGEINTAPAFNWPNPRPSKARSRKHPYSSFFRSEISTLLRDGRLARLLLDTTGLPSIRFWHDQLLYEEPRQKSETKYHWHQEETRWKTCQATEMLTAWIPLIDFSHDMGPITIVPRNHDLSDHKRMTLNQGDLVIFDKTITHGNPQNFGKIPRRALAAHFATGDLHYQPSGKFSHINERLVRTKNGVPDFTDPAVCPLLAPDYQGQ